MIVHKLDNSTGKILDTYKTLREAAEKNNCSASGIREACYLSCNGRTLKGYRWFAEDENTKRNYYKRKVNDGGLPLTLDEVNERVFKRREEIAQRRELIKAQRPNTLKIVCNKCLNTGSLNSYTNFNSLKEDDKFTVTYKDNELAIKCDKCNTKIIIGEM